MRNLALLAPRGSILTTGPQGGSSVVLLEDAQQLQAEGWGTRVFARAVGPGVPAETIPLHVPLPLVSSLEYCGLFVERNRGRILLAYNEPTVALLAPSRAVVRFDWPTPLPRYWRTALALRRFRRALYLFPSDALRRRWLERHSGIPFAQTRVIPNGIDLRLFCPARPTSGRPRRVGFAGQWACEKGLDVLLEAWDQVHRRAPDAELWLAGGPDLWRRRDGRLGQEGLGLLERVRTDGSIGVRSLGVLPRQQMTTFWSEVDLACVPSVCEEAFGMVALEAMACGVPVVATSAGGLPELVGDCGLIVPPRDPAALANAILTLLSSPQALSQLGASSRQKASGFGLDLRIRRLASLLDEVRTKAELESES